MWCVQSWLQHDCKKKVDATMVSGSSMMMGILHWLRVYAYVEAVLPLSYDKGKSYAVLFVAIIFVNAVFPLPLIPL